MLVHDRRRPQLRTKNEAAQRRPRSNVVFIERGGLVARRAPAPIRAATAHKSRRAPPSETAARRLFEQGRVLGLMVKAGRARCLGLRIGRDGHGSQHERRCRKRHCQFSHETLLHVVKRLPIRAGLLQRKDNTPGRSGSESSPHPGQYDHHTIRFAAGNGSAFAEGRSARKGAPMVLG